MALILNEEQKMLKDSAADFLKERSPIESLRRLRDTKDKQGYDTQVWQEMIEMGWTGLNIAEQYGGLGFGYVGLGQILEEIGRTLACSPLISSVVLGGALVNLIGTEAQKSILLSEIANGNMIVTAALDETNQHNPLVVNTMASKTEHGFVINGQKKFVLDGHIANQIIVSARTDSGIQLFVIPSDSEGLSVNQRILMDHRNASDISFENVSVPSSALLGKQEDAAEMIPKALDVARICLSAEMLGSMQEAFERTIAYLKERQQFGVPIGIFQGLQHRAAHMYCEIELCKGLVMKALQAIDMDSPDLAKLASTAKAKCGEVLQLVTNEAIQMFGGIGMTDDEEIGFFLKRARVAQQTFGDYNYHYDRYARLSGF
ncbi:MAG: acyl-CoA dehydrogenase [Bacteroidia bacterium]|nr:acyl-CoA dehydrogenase [Bacteroidia bacterium]